MFSNHKQHVRCSHAISNMAAPMSTTYSMILLRRAAAGLGLGLAAASDSIGQKPGGLTLQRDQSVSLTRSVYLESTRVMYVLLRILLRQQP